MRTKVIELDVDFTYLAKIEIYQKYDAEHPEESLKKLFIKLWMPYGSNNKNKNSSGFRVLWLPTGRRKTHKGQFDSTNRDSSYGMKQKKPEIWSLGGSKSHKDVIEAEPTTTLLDGPSFSGRVASNAVCATTVRATTIQQSSISVNTSEGLSPESRDGETLNSSGSTAPDTPNSNASTMLMHSSASHSPSATNNNGTTIKAEISDANRFAPLAQDIQNELEKYALPDAPKHSSHQHGNQTEEAVEKPTDLTSAAAANKAKQHNHNNNINHKSDVNSIESITDGKTQNKALNTDFDWIDELYEEHHKNDHSRSSSPSKHKKKKSKKVSTSEATPTATTKQMDQLDGVPLKNAARSTAGATAKEETSDDDEKLVKCLHYTLLCCDCAIS